MLHTGVFRHALVASALAVGVPAFGLDYTESLQGDLANDRLHPTRLLLSYGSSGNNGLLGNNVLTGSNQGGAGDVDLDYLNIVVPGGFELRELRVGNFTTSSGTSFIGLAAGNVILVAPGAGSAAGLLGWYHYSNADRNSDILDDLASAGNGASGFARPLSAGDYTLWIQALSSGRSSYRFNFQIAPVPEPSAYFSIITGLAVLGSRLRKLH